MIGRLLTAFTSAADCTPSVLIKRSLESDIAGRITDGLVSSGVKGNRGKHLYLPRLHRADKLPKMGGHPFCPISGTHSTLNFIRWRLQPGQSPTATLAMTSAFPFSGHVEGRASISTAHLGRR